MAITEILALNAGMPLVVDISIRREKGEREMDLTTQAQMKISSHGESPGTKMRPRVSVGRSHAGQIFVHSWPKVLCAYPVALFGLFVAIVIWLFPATPLLHAIFGRAFFVLLFLTALIATFDCRGWHIATVGLAVLCALLLFWVLSFYMPITAAVAWLWSQVNVQAPPQVYLFFPAVFGIIIGCAAVANRFDYWEITPNEVLHHTGPLSDLQRFPAANIEVEKEIPDVFEWILLGSGRLVIYPDSDRHAIVLDNVLAVNQVEEKIKHLLGAIQVRIDADNA